jgi:calcineurin-like phosphoesterase family protein
VNYYISDMHFFHKNIIRLCNRPFKDLEEMHSTIVKNWNKKVKDSDTIYILGDVSFGTELETDSILKQLNGIKILIKGNHDKYISKEINRVYQYLKINDENRQVILFHYPIFEWDGFYRDSIHLYGHVHNNVLNMPKNAFNVSCDVLDFEPKTLSEIIFKED